MDRAVLDYQDLIEDMCEDLAEAIRFSMQRAGSGEDLDEAILSLVGAGSALAARLFLHGPSTRQRRENTE